MKDQFHQDGIMIENALAFWVGRFYEGARRAMYRRFREHGFTLTPEQWSVLVRLWERDHRTQIDLAEAIVRDAPTTSRIVSAMERSGLVTRGADPTDARAKVISLTKKGSAAKPKLVPVVREMVTHFERGIPEVDLEITRRTLRKIAERLE